MVVDAAAVVEFHGGDELLEVPSSNLLLQPTTRDLVEEFAAAGVVHHQVDLCTCRRHLVKADDVWVMNWPHHRDFALDLLDQADLDDLLLADDLDHDTLPGLQVPATVNLRKCSLAKDSSQLVLVHEILN